MNFIKNISNLEKLITQSFLNPKKLKTTIFETPNLINNIFRKIYNSVVIIT